jgi:hypothetical protein
MCSVQAVSLSLLDTPVGNYAGTASSNAARQACGKAAKTADRWENAQAVTVTVRASHGLSSGLPRRPRPGAAGRRA